MASDPLELSPPLALAKRRSYNVLGVEVSRETLSLIALALAAGIVVGARIQRTTQRLTPCEDCERTRAETAASIRRGAADFERMRTEVGRRAMQARDGGGGEPGGSEGEEASQDDPGVASVPPPAPSSTGPSKDEPPAVAEVVRTPEGGEFPVIPPDASDGPGE